MRTSLSMMGALLFVGAAIAGADVVVLKNGGKLEGIVQDRGDRIRVEMEYGGIEMPRDLVLEVIQAPTALAEYRKRASALREDDAAGHYQLGVWALTKGLGQSARTEFEQVIALDPNHEAARKHLGFEKIDGRWLTYDEAMRARGFVSHEGQWVTREEFEMRQALAQEARLREEMRVAEERERRRQEYLARLEALADARLAALEEENARLRADRYARSYAGSYGYGYGVPVGYYGYGYPSGGGRFLTPFSVGTFVDQNGRFVSSSFGANGSIVWSHGDGEPIHTSGDGHCVLANNFTGQISHFPNSSCTGTPNLVLTPGAVVNPNPAFTAPLPTLTR